MRQSPDLPPLTALRVFETVSRLQSFRKAGEALCLSQSAVSYHVKTLETQLGVRLFTRHARGIDFTAEGEAYFAAVRQCFDDLGRATAALRADAVRGSVKVSVLPSFAAGWLVPRLAEFQSAHPQVEVAIDPRLALADLEAGEADLALRYGHGDWPGVQRLQLLKESVCPVLSPALLRQGPPIQAPADLLNHTLLMVSPLDEWGMWAAQHGLDLGRARRLQLVDYNIALQAAQDGQGVALGRWHLVAARLRDGLLVQALPLWAGQDGLGWWLCRRRGAQRQPVATFAQWLQRAARAALTGPDAVPAPASSPGAATRPAAG